ncbi:MAG: peptidylprolyl isomerase [Bacteroidetes bacterium]|nr:peptidylprolyl isomerase [Bacteroidota bacterium]
MTKKWGVLIISLCLLTSARSQTLFTYGKYSADAKDFMRAYNKNNTGPVTDKAKSIKTYLDLYINSRLKIREAYDRGYDTLSQLKDEVAQLRSQIIDTYVNDPESVNKMVDEAFKRSQKDIHLAHIFVSFTNSSGITDTLAAKKKIEEAYSKLQKGESFEAVAGQYSEDPAVKENKGDIGYITVFSLPYLFENAAYDTPVGKYTAPFRSSGGYHIFKVLGTRKALGKIKAAQILLAIPPGATDTDKKQIARLADSLYERLTKGDNILLLAPKFSNDNVSAGAGGLMPEFGVGQYDPVFENAILALPKNDVYSKPFLTSHGYHIVKRLSVTPVVSDPNDKNYREELKLKVQQSDRMETTKINLFNMVMKTAGFKKYAYNENDLWSFSDSLLDLKHIGRPLSVNRETELFTIGNKTLTVQDWINYAQTFRYKTDGSGFKPYSQVMDEFIRTTALGYYRDHLEDYNTDFRYQMEEFKDGNIFFEIMQREIWNKAQSDSAALEGFYNKHKTQYVWKQSADAVVFFCSDEATGKFLFDQVKKKPSSWKKIADALAEKVIADSARFEWSQIPNKTKMTLQAGMVTSPVVNKNDNSSSFAYVIKLYPTPTQRSFEEAKGLVVNDYQNELEQEWITDLKKKYPVTIDEKVLNSLIK